MRVCLAAETPSFETDVVGAATERLGGADAIERHWVTDLAVGRRIFDDVAASWKVLVDNFMECHHYATTHHELTEVLPEVATVIREEPISRRYSPEATAAAVRTVRALRTELGIGQGTVSRVARQLGHGVESVRYWVRQADIGDGYAPGVSSAESARIKEVEQENRELKRANVILKQAGSFFGPELDRQHKK